MARIRIENLSDDAGLNDDEMKEIFGKGVGTKHSLESARALFAERDAPRSNNPFLKDVDPEDLLD